MEGKIKLVWLSTKLQIADVQTKPLSVDAFTTLRGRFVSRSQSGKEILRNEQNVSEQDEQEEQDELDELETNIHPSNVRLTISATSDAHVSEEILSFCRRYSGIVRNIPEL